MILKELENLEGAHKLKFLIENKAAILKAKKGMIKTADPISSTPNHFKSTATKSMLEEGLYKIVANSCGFFDSHQDVSLRGSFDKTVREKGNALPIIINHDHSPQAIFAKNKGVEIEEIQIKSLGYDMEGTTQCVTAKIDPKYNEKMSELYEGGEIKQHSIGLRYVQIELAINDSSDNEAFAAWNKYIGQVINRSEAEANGYFFAVKEQQLFEISAVLFGSNQYTPTLSLNTQEPQKSIALRDGEPKKLNFSFKF